MTSSIIFKLHEKQNRKKTRPAYQATIAQPLSVISISLFQKTDASLLKLSGRFRSLVREYRTEKWSIWEIIKFSGMANLESGAVNMRDLTPSDWRWGETILMKIHFAACNEVIAVSDRNKILSCPGQNYHIYYRLKVITSAIFQQTFNYTSQRTVLNGTRQFLNRWLAKEDFQRLYSHVRSRRSDLSE